MPRWPPSLALHRPKTKLTSQSKMATTSGSESSSLAPTDFRLCSSLDDSSGVISVAVEHCQLCDGTRRLFYCKDCVQNGEFVHSRSTHSDRWVPPEPEPRPSGQGQGAIINDNAMDMVPSLLTGIGLIRYGGGRLEFLPGHIYLFHKEDGKLYFFTSG